MQEVTRRNFVKGAAIAAAGAVAAGAMSGCSVSISASETSEGTGNTVLDPKEIFDSKTGKNFNVVPDSATTVGTTLENLKAAVQGETNANAKYTAWAEVAEKAGFDQIARLFRATAAAEQIHINLEIAEIKKVEPNYTQPSAQAAANNASDINLILAAEGEIYETSDMYPSFIKVATLEGESGALTVFERAKQAEAYHAQNYMDAYNLINTPGTETYYVCPVCGYIHKGEDFTACPICLTKKSAFSKF